MRSFITFVCRRQEKDAAYVIMAKITTGNLLLAVTVTFVTGSLLHRVYPSAGLVVMACALGFYLLCGAKRTFRALPRFTQADGPTKWRVVLWFGVLLLGVNILRVIFSGGSVHYFFALVIFAVDFLVQHKTEKNEDR